MKKQVRLFRFVIAIVLMTMVFPVSFADEQSAPAHPLVQVQRIDRNTATPDRFTNILLLGVDYGFEGYWGSHHKQALEECHTDAFIVVSINRTKNTVDMISIPRDTVTYVPGVQGLYKLNAAFNCGDTLEQGFKHACDAASWVLGGVRIDYYVCVDMNAMIELGDFIGGADIDVEMSYTSAGKHYEKGLQHLDGRGLMDYARARKNATYDATDLGRTARQRQVVEGIAQTLASDINLVKPAWNFATGGQINFYTNLKLGTLVNLFNEVKDVKTIGNHVITGDLRKAANWNFMFTDQAARLEVLGSVFGINAEELRFVGYDDIKWLENFGFDYVHALNLAKQMISFGKRMGKCSGEQETALNALKEAYNRTLTAFNKAAATHASADEKELKNAAGSLYTAGNAAAAILGFSESKQDWNKASAWNNDPYINEYQLDWA